MEIDKHTWRFLYQFLHIVPEFKPIFDEDLEIEGQLLPHLVASAIAKFL